MRKLMYLFLFTLVLTACGKKDVDNSREDLYVCEDFSNKEIQVLGVHTEDIDALWSEIYTDNDGRTTFSLFAKRNDGPLIIESGIITEDGFDVTFSFEDGKSLIGEFESDGLSFDLNYVDGQRQESFRFVWMDNEDYKGGKKGDKWKWN